MGNFLKKLCGRLVFFKKFGPKPAKEYSRKAWAWLIIGTYVCAIGMDIYGLKLIELETREGLTWISLIVCLVFIWSFATALDNLRIIYSSGKKKLELLHEKPVSEEVFI